MRHRHGLRKLNRTSSHRLAMFRNLANALIQHESIRTTLPKAKELRKVLEPLITMGKKPTLANKRLAFSRLRDRNNVVKLFRNLVQGLKIGRGAIREFIKTDLGLATMHQWRSWNLWRKGSVQDVEESNS